MLGGMADAFFGGVPPEIKSCVENLLTPDLWEITQAFCEKYC